MYVVTAEKCSGCATCVDVCPSGAISMVEEVAVINGDECSDCGSCEAECPNEAISPA